MSFCFVRAFFELHFCRRRSCQRSPEEMTKAFSLLLFYCECQKHFRSLQPVGFLRTWRLIPFCFSSADQYSYILLKMLQTSFNFKFTRKEQKIQVKYIFLNLKKLNTNSLPWIFLTFLFRANSKNNKKTFFLIHCTQK